MLDEAALQEVIDGMTREAVAVPSDHLLRSLAAAAGLNEAALRALFERRFRDHGNQTRLFDDLPFSGSG
jgi:hypothetical protein